jgi:hypothetical protein
MYRIQGRKILKWMLRNMMHTKFIEETVQGWNFENIIMDVSYCVPVLDLM